MVPWRACIPLVADSHHLKEEHDLDTDPSLSEKLDPDPHLSDADPQPWVQATTGLPYFPEPVSEN